MEQSLPIWLIPVLTLLGGVVIGLILARVLRRTAPGQTQRQLFELQERFEDYQSEVVTHFNTTATLVKKLTQNYQDVQAHLATGADRLALDDASRERLLAGLIDEPQAQERIDAPQDAKTVEDSESTLSEEITPPRDYVPKAEGEPGTLSEDYSAKR